MTTTTTPDLTPILDAVNRTFIALTCCNLLAIELDEALTAAEIAAKPPGSVVADPPWI